MVRAAELIVDHVEAEYQAGRNSFPLLPALSWRTFMAITFMKDATRVEAYDRTLSYLKFMGAEAEIYSTKTMDYQMNQGGYTTEDMVRVISRDGEPTDQPYDLSELAGYSDVKVLRRASTAEAKNDR